jgi:hypothetical protein
VGIALFGIVLVWAVLRSALPSAPALELEAEMPAPGAGEAAVAPGEAAE